MKKKQDTILTHAGCDPLAHHGAVNVPPYRATTVVFKNFAEFESAEHAYEGEENGTPPYAYGRSGTPSSAAFEEAVAELEGAHGSVATCSGLSAVLLAVMSFTRAGGHVLMPDNCYGPARRAYGELFSRYGVEIEYYPPMIKNIAPLFRPETQLVFMEAPGSLTFEVQDIGAIAAAAKKAGIKTAMDNSWASPLFLKPLDLGIDVSVMSATKYAGGHSDAMLGVVSGTKDSYPALRRTAIILGMCPGSEEVYLGLRGLRTLHVRMGQHEKSALHLAHWLSEHPAVRRVLHPALPSCPGHDNWRKYFKGSSGTFGIILKEKRKEKIAAMLDNMELFRLGFSWGGFESLIFAEQPGPRTRTAEPWQEEGFSIRLHVGLEDVHDLQADLDAGLKRLA